MSTLNKINWEDPSIALTRDNLAKMTDDIVTLDEQIQNKEPGKADHFLSTLGERMDKNIRNLQEGAMVNTQYNPDSSTVVITDKASTEVYQLGRANLFKGLIDTDVSEVPNDGVYGNLYNYLNPLPAGLYGMYIIGKSTEAYTITITSRYNKKSKSATNVDNLIYVITKTVKANEPFTFAADNGIDYITIITNSTNILYSPVILSVASLNTTVNVESTLSSAHIGYNLMPSPQYDYNKSNVAAFDSNDAYPMVGGLKFAHLANGAIWVKRATDYNKDTGTSKAVSFYFHNGTETRFPEGVYTFGCRTYKGEDYSYTQDTIARLKILARWDDGDNQTYYPETLENGVMGSAKGVSYEAPITVNATHGINSITALLYFPKGAKIPELGLIYKPSLVEGNTQLRQYNYSAVSDAAWYDNTVYRYNNNLLISRSPKVYNYNANGTYLGTPGTTKNGLPYAESNGVSITQVASGCYVLNGTATADTEFQICPGYTYMSPIGTFDFGGIPANADDKISLVARVRYLDANNKYKSMKDITATPGVDAQFTSTYDNRMQAYYNARIRIKAGAICNNTPISWYIKPHNIGKADRYKMPVASAGIGPMYFDYYKTSDSIYITNPQFNLVVNALGKCGEN